MASFLRRITGHHGGADSHDTKRATSGDGSEGGSTIPTSVKGFVLKEVWELTALLPVQLRGAVDMREDYRIVRALQLRDPISYVTL